MLEIKALNLIESSYQSVHVSLNIVVICYIVRNINNGELKRVYWLREVKRVEGVRDSEENGESNRVWSKHVATESQRSQIKRDGQLTRDSVFVPREGQSPLAPQSSS